MANRKNARLPAAVTMLTLFLGVALGFGAQPAFAASCSANQTCGSLYYTQIGCCVDKAAFVYDDVAHTVSFTPTLLTNSLPGADGIIFDPVTHDLMVGVNCGGSQEITEVDPTSGAVTSTISTTGVSPSHLMADVSGNAWYSADGCGSNNQGMVAFGSSSGTVEPFTGDTTYVNTLIWNLNTPNENLAYYTSSPCCGGGGQFGTLDVSTGVTTCVKSGGICENFPGAHGGFFDPYTGDVIIVGGEHITQIDPTTLTVVSDLVVPGVTFDQGSADGLGHLFVANNGGSIYFLDFSASKQVSSALNFADNITGSGVAEADDVAPLVGQGSTATGVPEFPLGPVLLIAIAVPMMLLLRQRALKLPVTA